MKTEKELQEEIKEIRIKINVISEKTTKESKKFFLFPSKAGIYLHQWGILSNKRNELKAELRILQERNAEVKQAIEDVWEKHLDNYTNRLQHKCNLCKAIEELLQKLGDGE